jgi:hypothetical protein
MRPVMSVATGERVAGIRARQQAKRFAYRGSAVVVIHRIRQRRFAATGIAEDRNLVHCVTPTFAPVLAKICEPQSFGQNRGVDRSIKRRRTQICSGTLHACDTITSSAAAVPTSLFWPSTGVERPGRDVGNEKIPKCLDRGRYKTSGGVKQKHAPLAANRPLLRQDLDQSLFLEIVPDKKIGDQGDAGTS